MELTACRQLRQKITALEERLSQLRDVSIKTQTFDAAGVRTAAAESMPEKLTRLIVDGETELEKLRAEFALTADELASEIFSRVTDTKCAQVLMLRYVACRPFAEIADEVNYTLSHVFKLHRDGVSAFAKAGAKIPAEIRADLKPSKKNALELCIAGN